MYTSCFLDEEASDVRDDLSDADKNDDDQSNESLDDAHSEAESDVNDANMTTSDIGDASDDEADSGEEEDEDYSGYYWPSDEGLWAACLRFVKLLVCQVIVFQATAEMSISIRIQTLLYLFPNCGTSFVIFSACDTF